MIEWLIVAVAVTGVVLNVLHRWQGFIFWIISNGYWLLCHARSGQWPEAVLFAFFVGVSVWGIIAWSKCPPLLRAARVSINTLGNENKQLRQERRQVRKYLRRLLTVQNPPPGKSVKVTWIYKEAERLYELLK
jgi:hypothetical protein